MAKDRLEAEGANSPLQLRGLLRDVSLFYPAPFPFCQLSVFGGAARDKSHGGRPAAFSAAWRNVFHFKSTN